MNTETDMPVSPRWEDPAVVHNFSTNAPNENLLRWAGARHAAGGGNLLLDIGGGAARNAQPLAHDGYEVTCTDLSFPMLQGARQRLSHDPWAGSIHLVHAPMAPLPFPDRQFDVIVAHGIWNLAASSGEFRLAVREAARVARPDAGLFLFTFARETIGDGDRPVPGETWVFDQFNGEPQCFLTQGEYLQILEEAGFYPESDPVFEVYNCPPTPRRTTTSPPVLYEGTFSYRLSPE